MACIWETGEANSAAQLQLVVRRIHTRAGASENISGSQTLNCTPDVQSPSVSVVLNASRIGKLPELLENPIDEPYTVPAIFEAGCAFQP